MLPTIVGRPLSILTETVALAVFPALSETVAITDWSLPSPVMICGAGQFTTPDTASEQT
jgi:hypothetical protein